MERRRYTRVVRVRVSVTDIRRLAAVRVCPGPIETIKMVRACVCVHGGEIKTRACVASQRATSLCARMRKSKVSDRTSGERESGPYSGTQHGTAP